MIDPVHVQDNSDDDNHIAYDFKQRVHAFSLLDYSGFLCAGFQNAHRQMEARNEALDRAAHDSSVKAGDTIHYSYVAAEVQAGAPCGIKIYKTSGGDGSVDGQDFHASLSGWSAFGGFSAPFEGSEEWFWKAMIYGDFRELHIDGGGKNADLIQMPIEYEVGKIVNVPGVAGFIVSGMIGYDPIFALMKSLAPDEMPASFIRYGVTAGYQTPVQALQVRLSYRSTDEGFDSHGFKERPIILGVYYQM
jgi:hypothetical protein